MKTLDEFLLDEFLDEIENCYLCFVCNGTAMQKKAAKIIREMRLALMWFGAPDREFGLKAEDIFNETFDTVYKILNGEEG